MTDIKNILLGEGQFIIPGLTLLEELFSGIRSVGLKQFRDAVDGTRACYQAIIEAPLRTAAFNGGGLFQDPFEFTLNDLASHPVAQDTGLAIGTQQVEAAFWLNMSITMGNGSVVWQAATGS